MSSRPDTELRALYKQDPNAAREHLRHVLHLHGGLVLQTARYLNCSKNSVWDWLARLEMMTEPTVIRHSRRSFYRLS